MNLELHIFKDLPAEMQADTAEKISAYTNGQLGEIPQMLPVTPDDIYQKFLGVVVINDIDFAGYIGATQPYNHNGIGMTEVGSLWVPFSMRKNGIAHQLVGYASDVLIEMGLIPYAFCNPISHPIFEQKDFVIASPDEIPPEAFGECIKCPSKPSHQRCCDTILIKK